MHNNQVKVSEATKNDKGIGTSTEISELVLAHRKAGVLRIMNLMSGPNSNTQPQRPEASSETTGKGEGVDNTQAASSQHQANPVSEVADYSDCVFMMQACVSRFPVLEGVYSTVDAAITAAENHIGRFGEIVIQKYSGNRFLMAAGNGPIARARVFPEKLLGATKAADVKVVYAALDIGHNGSIAVTSAHDTVSILLIVT